MQAMILSIALLLTPYDKLPFHFLLMFPQIYGLLRIVFKIEKSIVGVMGDCRMTVIVEFY